MEKEDIIKHGTGLAFGVAAVLAFIFGKRKRSAELKKIEMEGKLIEFDMAIKAIEVWKDLAEEFESKVKSLTLKLERFEDLIKKLELQNKMLTNELFELKNQISQYKNNNL